MTDPFAAILHAVARPAALFLAGVTVALGTLAATGSAPAFPIAAPDTLLDATIARSAEPWTGDITFDAIDGDADGRIGRDEFALWFTLDDPTGDAFALFDLNGNGAIDVDEWDVLAFELLD